MTDELETEFCDHEAARLLPWFVMGALSPEDSARMQAHLQECDICARDEKREQRMRALMSSEPAVEHVPQPGLQKLMARIDELEWELPGDVSVESLEQMQPPPRAGWVRWLVAAVIVQTIGLGVLGALLWEQGVRLQEPRFSTLTSSASQANGAPHVRVVFAPTMQVAQVQALLASIPATVALGPSEAGVYTLALSGKSESIDSVLAQLRAHPGVLFAEPQLERSRP